MDWKYRLSFVGLSVVAVTWAGCTDPNACTSDSDCFEGQFCGAGTCVERPDDGPDASGTDTELPPEDTGEEKPPDDSGVDDDTRRRLRSLNRQQLLEGAIVALVEKGLLSATDILEAIDE